MVTSADNIRYTHFSLSNKYAVVNESSASTSGTGPSCDAIREDKRYPRENLRENLRQNFIHWRTLPIHQEQDTGFTKIRK